MVMQPALAAFTEPGRLKRIIVVTGLIVVLRFIAHIPLPHL